MIHPQVELLTSSEVARRAGVNVATLRRWVRDGKYPRRRDGSASWIVTPGDHLRFHADVVEVHWPR